MNPGRLDTSFCSETPSQEDFDMTHLVKTTQNVAMSIEELKMNTTRILGLSALALALAIPTAQAEDRAKLDAARPGEHPAVIVARRGVQVDPTSNFYLHPARLSWSLQRPMSEGEHPAVIVARRGVQADPTSNFYLHPARLSWSLQRPMSEDEPLEMVVAGGGKNAASHP
jgi:hypothetical protein